MNPASEACVRDRFGPVEAMVGRGLSNVKFRGDGVLVRVNETVRAEVALGRFRKAAFCAELCGRVGVSVPEVLEVGTLPNGRPYSVERWVDGAPADLLRDEGDRVRVWEQLGAEMRKLHLAILGGREREFAFGYDGEGPTETWAEHARRSAGRWRGPRPSWRRCGAG